MTNVEFKEWLEKIDHKLDLVHTQTTKTNGRVNSLERFRSIVLWISGASFTGAVSALIAVLVK
jgi:hypothetical protein